MHRYEPYPHDEHHAMIYYPISYDTYAQDVYHVKIAAVNLTIKNVISPKVKIFFRRKKQNKPQTYILETVCKVDLDNL